MRGGERLEGCRACPFTLHPQRQRVDRWSADPSAFTSPYGMSAVAPLQQRWQFCVHGGEGPPASVLHGDLVHIEETPGGRDIAQHGVDHGVLGHLREQQPVVVGHKEHDLGSGGDACHCQTQGLDFFDQAVHAKVCFKKGLDADGERRAPGYPP